MESSHDYGQAELYGANPDQNYVLSGLQDSPIDRWQADISPWDPVRYVPENQPWQGGSDPVPPIDHYPNDSRDATQGSDEDAQPAPDGEKKDSKKDSKKAKKAKKTGEATAKNDAKGHSKKDGKDGHS